MKEIYEIEYKGSFRTKGKKTKEEILEELRINIHSFKVWGGGVLFQFDDIIDELEEEIRNEKDNIRV